jgi:hypothetical protein
VSVLLSGARAWAATEVRGIIPAFTAIDAPSFFAPVFSFSASGPAPAGLTWFGLANDQGTFLAFGFVDFFNGLAGFVFRRHFDKGVSFGFGAVLVGYQTDLSNLAEFFKHFRQFVSCDFNGQITYVDIHSVYSLSFSKILAKSMGCQYLLYTVIIFGRPEKASTKYKRY